MAPTLFTKCAPLSSSVTRASTLSGRHTEAAGPTSTIHATRAAINKITLTRGFVLSRGRRAARIIAHAEESDEDVLKEKTEQVQSGEKTWAESFPQSKKANEQAQMKQQGVTAVSGTDASPMLMKLAGGTSPMGDAWDPLSLTADLDDNTLKRYREAELAHCRVAMLASTGILVGENFPVINDIFNGGITGPAINQFQQIQRPFWELIVFGIGLAETTRAQIGWMPPTEGIFKLRPEYDAGDLDWDPLGLRPSNKDELLEMRNKELNNGRLAMIGVAGMVVQELLDEKPVLPLHGGMLG